MIKTIIVEDEKPAEDLLCKLLSEHCSDVEVVSTASSIKSAFKMINKHNPELIFLDIKMSDGSGFDLLKMFKQLNFSVVFVTAYSEHAIKAFRHNAIDYLLKPVKIDELKSAVEKVKNINNNGNDFKDFYKNINALLKSIGELPSGEGTIVIPHLKGFDVLKISEIIMCSADSYCTNFHLTGKRKIISSKNLKQYEDILISHKFIRVHHSYLVNLNHICSYTKQGEIFLAENNKAFLGDSFKQQFVKSFLKK